MANRFFKARNLSELKKEYLKLLKQLHPDNGGDTATFQEMQAEHDKLLKTLPLGSADSKQSEKTADETEKTDFSDFASSEAMQDPVLRAALFAVAGLDGIDVEVCGRWIWISGDTYKHREILKANGFRWASKKQMWSFHNAEKDGECHRHKAQSQAHIRMKYGSTFIGGFKACLD